MEVCGFTALNVISKEMLLSKTLRVVKHAPLIKTQIFNTHKFA